ncbi:MAG: PilT/PilU family type 4a pilus ATPase [Candidatus Riflebacteria bacterium]|nr:PilT/PilU family type 4a pilus ATPase [Candidatus Riflebacteria bacterium]
MIFELLKLCYEKGASDLHFKVGYPPVLRIDGSMIPMKKMPVITEVDYEVMLEGILDDYQLIKFKEHKKLDLGYSFLNTRFRVNLFYDFHGGNAVFRMIPFLNLSFDDIGLPKAGRLLIERPHGLIMVTGATGAGKSTTLSAFITHINNTRTKSIITIEDPIEYIFMDNKSIISQRQVGVDCPTFDRGIRGALQTDADIIMVGELRDPEAVEMTLMAAECGKLVFATLHSNTSVQGIDRFVNLFPIAQQSQIMSRLSTSLLGIITQTLIPKKMSKGRIAAFEILIAIPTVKGLIGENRMHMIQSYQEAGGETGMCTLDQSLALLISQNKISAEEGMMKAVSPTVLKKYLEQQSIPEETGGKAQ